MILVSSADIFLSKSLRILAERITQKGIVSPPEKVCDTPTYRGGGTSTLSYVLGKKNASQESSHVFIILLKGSYVSSSAERQGLWICLYLSEYLSDYLFLAYL